jgi:NAD(P)-dependent dehydrogenase (short-subunit alcohol dehydrogenase family)
MFASYPSLNNAVFLVSGGASGIGADIVKAAHDQGAKVAFFDILESEGKALAAECKGSMFITCDLTDIAAIKAAVEKTRADLGPVRVLVNNAANDDRKQPQDIDEAYWDWSMDVNLKHQFFLAKEVLPHMKELGGGSIINFSSIAWRYGADNMAAYSTAKSAVIGLTRMLARNYGPHNIRVNAIEPGAVMTEKQRRLWHTTQDAIDRMIGHQKIKRMLTADEIARTVMFLAS